MSTFELTAFYWLLALALVFAGKIFDAVWERKHEVSQEAGGD